MSLLDSFDTPTTLLATFAAFILYLLISFIGKLRAVGFARTRFFLFEPYAFPGALLPTTWWNGGTLYTWTNRSALYKDGDTFAYVPLFGPPYVFTRSAEVARQVTAHKAPFDRTVFGTLGLRIFGDNVVTTMYHDQWNRHRKVVNPAFNQRLYRQVWDSSVKTFKDMSAGEGWDMKDTVDLPDIGPLVGKFALLIITAVGLGLPLPWSDPPGGAEGEEMTLLEAFRTMTDNLLVSIATPKWAKNLPFETLRRVKMSHGKIFSVMQDFVTERRSLLANKTEKEKVEESRTIFSLLLDANDSESGKAVLSDQELFSNVFVMLFAGHETSAQTMGATLGLLSIYPDEQEKAHVYVKSLLGERDPAIDDFDALRPIQACLLEALRLFLTAALLIRRPLEDGLLRPDGEDTSVPVSKNTVIVCDMTGISYNPRYYPDPTVYKPSRWSGSDEPEFLAFGSGPRACIGRKFAMYEMTCFLALLLRDWKVEPVLLHGEDAQAWRKRVLEDTVTLTITMGPGKVPLRMSRRA